MTYSTIVLDQQTIDLLRPYDPVVVRYRAFFALFDWDAAFPKATAPARPGKPPHPEMAYVNAFLVKICEHHQYVTQLRRFLIEPPLLVLEVGFHPFADPTCLYGFNSQKTVPCDRWLRDKQHTLDPLKLQQLLHATITALHAEIPGLGEVVSFDVKHIYAWVRENNPRESIKDRFCKDRQPKGDPDCKVGVKKSTSGATAAAWLLPLPLAMGMWCWPNTLFLSMKAMLPISSRCICKRSPCSVASPPISPLMRLLMRGMSMNARLTMTGWRPFRSISTLIPSLHVTLMEFHGARKDCVCIPPTSLPIPTATPLNGTAVLSSSRNPRARRAIMSNLPKARAASKTSTLKKGDRCVSPSIAAARSTRAFTRNAPQWNASIANRKLTESNAPRCAIAARSADSIR